MENQPRKKLELDRLQSKIIDEFADIVTQEIDLSKTIIKGFYWKSIREWQKIHNRTLAETEQGSGSTFKERKEQAIQISDIFEGKVLNSTNVNPEKLKAGINKALTKYLATHAKR